MTIEHLCAWKLIIFPSYQQIKVCMKASNEADVKVKVVVYSPDIHDYVCSTDFTFPLARWEPMQPATIDPALDLCARCPLRLGGQRQCEIRSLRDTSTHDQFWESNPRPCGVEFNALSTWLYSPTAVA